MVDNYWEYDSTYRGIEIQRWMPGAIAYGAWIDGDWIVRVSKSALQGLIDDWLGPEEPETWWEYDSTYRGIEIQRWMPGAIAYGAWIDGDWIVRVSRLALEGLIDDWLGPEVAGHIGAILYWIAGMPGWAYLDEYPTPAKVGDNIHLAVYWWNDGSSAVVGNVGAQFTSPALYPYRPNAVAGQDRTINPGGGAAVQFAPVTLNESGSWKFFGTLTLDGATWWIDSKTITIAVEEAAIGIPTTTTLSAPDRAGVGEKFNISGILYETESSIAIPSQPINHSYNGKNLGSSTTGVDGDYLKEVSIPEAGTWTLKAEFPGTDALQTSRALADAVVGEISIETPLLIAGPIVTGLALVIYGLM